MKYVIKCLLFASLFYACEEVEHVSESFSEINEFLIQREPEVTTTLRSSGDSKETFVSGDQIYVYGFSKPVAGASTLIDGRVRFMPTVGEIGTIYEYERNRDDGWHRFKRTPSLIDPEIGYWRTKQYHDFTAYYYDHTPAQITRELELEMTATGLPKEELLWGEVKDIYFSGEALVIPEIKFKHQLSRIRVLVMHDMADIAAEDFDITGIQFKLDKSAATFNLETGEWTNSVSEEHQIAEAFTDLEMDDFPKLEFQEITDLWVLPYCTISDFKFSLIQHELPLPDFSVNFEGHFDDSGTGNPTTIVTKPGYITTLRILFGKIKPIIFTVSLDPWDVQSKTSTITDIEEL